MNDKSNDHKINPARLLGGCQRKTRLKMTVRNRVKKYDKK